MLTVRVALAPPFDTTALPLKGQRSRLGHKRLVKLVQDFLKPKSLGSRGRSAQESRVSHGGVQEGICTGGQGTGCGAGRGSKRREGELAWSKAEDNGPRQTFEVVNLSRADLQQVVVGARVAQVRLGAQRERPG